MNRISNFLIKCAGADQEILDACTVKEKNKFTGIGSTLLLTAVLASLSGGYAIHSTFDSVLISIILGVFWGIVIFSLDRYIVTSIDKKGVWWKQLLTAFPRLLIAFVLAITISKPLELRLFQDAVNKSMGEIANASISGCEADWNKERDKLAKSKSNLEDERKQKTEEIYNKDGIYTDFVKEQKEISGLNQTNQNKISVNNSIISRGTSYPNLTRNDGSIIYKEDGSPRKTIRRNAAANNAFKINNSLRSEINRNNIKIGEFEVQKNNRKQVLRRQVVTTEAQYTNQISGVQQQINDHNNKRQVFLADCTNRSNNAKDLPAQLQALSKLTDENESIAWASLLITLLFVILETAPVVVKLLSSTGTYEEILEAKEYAISMEQKIKISNLNDEINTVLKISSEKNKNKLEAELKGNVELLNEIALAQAEIAKIAVLKWKEEEIEKLQNSNNNSIVNSNIVN
ncbi:protein of unknown function [Flavobacterium segetis]|uniref:DUF4407 domain-containing protein n=1 Tax=Flavobacterium segetis TaxID=271157 RepID=A0A1M5ECK9_9FLAO|nr:DUF4407 domain-containing protein [Flavobacterium segetis]SHF76822.1 protein of unknown function [Flavobacterium segetis]